MRELHGGEGAEIGGARAAADVGGGEAALHESASLHGADGGGDSAAVYAVCRGECGGGEGEGGSVHGVLAGWECDGGVFGEFDKLLGDEAHERLDAAGARERQGRRGGVRVGADL